MTDCAIIGNYSTENLAVAVEILNTVIHTLWNWIYEAVFQIGEAGFKLFVTTWVPRFMQSVYLKAITK